MSGVAVPGTDLKRTVDGLIPCTDLPSDDNLSRNTTRYCSTSKEEALSIADTWKTKESDVESGHPPNEQHEGQASPHTDMPTPPDGGLMAWLQVLSGFMLYLNSWGLTTAFGVFQQYYYATYLPRTPNSTISWIGTVMSFMLSLSATFAGPMIDRGHPGYVVLCGGFLVTFGYMMTSLCKSYWQIILAQGIVVGIGSGQMFVVATTVIAQWFTSHRGFATGVAATGSSLGGIIYPIVFHRLVGQIGFGWTTRVIGFIVLATTCISFATTRMLTKPPPRPKIVDLSGFQEASFILFGLKSFFGGIGLYVPFFYITEYTIDKVPAAGTTLAFYMLPIMGAGSIIGRLIPSFAADKVGGLNVLTAFTAIASLLAFCWIAVTDTVPGLVVWSILYGLFSGTFVSLQTVVVAAITTDKKLMGGRIGMNNLCMAFGVLIGNPVAGAILKDWVGLQAFCGAVLLIATLFTAVTRCFVFGSGLKVKA